MNWEKLRSPATATFKNIKIPLCTGKNCNFATMDELRKLCPNLSFTVENKMGNLHKIRLFTFQT